MSPRKAARKPLPTTTTTNGDEVVTFTFRMRAEQLVALRQVQADGGIPVTQQLRRAIDLWLARQK
jgi:hypothetical protein